MSSEMTSVEESVFREQLKRLIIRTLNLEGVRPETIGDDQPLFGQGLGLDSVDALELLVALEKEFGMSLETHEVDRSALASVASLARFIWGRQRRAGTQPGEA
jgi:acyl carrier protein